MATLLRAHCECSFSCELIIGLTHDGMYVPSFCAACNTFVSALQLDGLLNAARRCIRCEGPVSPALLDRVSCPWCSRPGLYFRTVSVVT